MKIKFDHYVNSKFTQKNILFETKNGTLYKKILKMTMQMILMMILIMILIMILMMTLDIKQNK